MARSSRSWVPGASQTPRTLAQKEDLKKTEKNWLRRVEHLLDFEDTELHRRLPSGAVARAEQAYRLLIA
jgi:hypothetical protein